MSYIGRFLYRHLDSDRYDLTRSITYLCCSVYLRQFQLGIISRHIVYTVKEKHCNTNSAILFEKNYLLSKHWVSLLLFNLNLRK